jgi:hypothetical protein
MAIFRFGEKSTLRKHIAAIHEKRKEADVSADYGGPHKKPHMSTHMHDMHKMNEMHNMKDVKSEASYEESLWQNFRR